MEFLLDIFTLVLGLGCTITAIRKIISSNYSVLHLCILLFFIIQVVPIFVNYFCDLSVIERRTQYEYLAIKDSYTNILYDFFCVFTMLILLYFGNKYSTKVVRQNLTVIRLKSSAIVFLLALLMFLPVAGVIFSPDPSVYYVFSFLYAHNFSYSLASVVYHNHVMIFIDYIAFFSILSYYYYKSTSKKAVFLTIVSSCILVWVDGKRGILAMLIVGFILVDFLKWRSKSYKKLIIKSVLLILLFAGYFAIYSVFADKYTDDSNFITYNAYFSRLGEVKMSIYSRSLGPNSMLPYDGATIIYDLFAFVPRTLWPDKPYGFFNYLTSFAYFGNGSNFLEGSNYQVNIWSEYFANFGLLGSIISVALILFVVRYSEKSSNRLVKMLGGVFVLTYMILGFEMIVMLEFYLWIFLVVRGRLNSPSGKVFQRHF